MIKRSCHEKLLASPRSNNNAQKPNLKTRQIKKPCRPEPVPPVKVRPKKLSVTEIKTLIRDPYSIYVRRILKIEPLERLDKFSAYALRGIVYHSIFEKFMVSWHDNADLDWHIEKLKETASDIIKVSTSNKILQTLPLLHL